MATTDAPNTTTLPEGALQPTTTEQAGSRKVISVIDTLLNTYQFYKLIMEKRLNNKVDQYIQTLKNDLHNKILASNHQDRQQVSELVQYLFEYPKLNLEKEDFVKRKRVKNSIPEVNRCIAKRANGEQCTRRRKEECEYCGTHSKGTPHGTIQNEDEAPAQNQTMEVFAEEIKGIVYYLDKYNNVYNTEDIMNNRENPRIIGKWEKHGHNYSIPSLGLI